ncbi:4Fe-4S dicluster domain-containing protein [bacterium]|nr:MAG: 4Fe-4S dicluster domain-containing protein [bacterium]
MKLLVNFSRKAGQKPIIAQVVKETGVLINVERAIIDSSEGEALIDIPDEACKIVKEKMASLGATVRVLDHGIILDETECISCGACVSICPHEVFYLDDQFVVRVREGRCVLCGRCLDSCPHQALYQ